MAGDIPIEFGSMDGLEVLSFSGNGLGPDLPVELSSLPNLKDLDLSNCFFSALPGALVNDAPSLLRLNLSTNAITATGLPTEWTSTSLATLDLSGNQLVIPFPALALSSMTNLTKLEMRECSLIDGLPTEVGSFVALEALDLGTNLVEGTLPDELGLITTLRRYVV